MEEAMDFNDIMRMLQNPGAIKAQAEALKAKTEAIEVTGSSGGGMVKITLNGALEMKGCEIAKEVVDPEDIGMLQDLVRAAYNDASAKAKEALEQELGSNLGSMGLPPGLFGGIA
jgi:DNA-binding YbaB/EbfC family protein